MSDVPEAENTGRWTSNPASPSACARKASAPPSAGVTEGQRVSAWARARGLERSFIKVSSSLIDPDQNGEFGAHVRQCFGRNRGADRSNGTSQGVDAAHMAREDFTYDGQAVRQNDARCERTHAPRDRAHDRKAGGDEKRLIREHQGRTPPGLLAARGRVEIRPDQVSLMWAIGLRHSTASRPTSSPQVKASRIASGVAPSNNWLRV